MFKDLGIKGRVLLLTLLPTSLLAMVLGGYFTWVQLSDMRAQLIERGQLIAEQLAPLAATALARKDTAVLNRIANEALDQPDVRAVTFLDARQERLAHAGPSMLTVAPAGDASHLSMSTELDTTHFLLPVLGRHHSLSGATEPDDERVLGWVELELSHHGTLLRGYRSLFTSLLLIAAGLGVTALLALRSAGYNHVDLAAAEALGLPVVHVPAYSPHAVAEHAVGLILTLNRRLHRAYNRTREGDFSLHGLTGFDLHGKRVGVIGTGQIGETFARIMAGFGCELLAYDPYPNPRIQALGGRYLALDALLAESDIVSLHCPLTADTRHLIDAQRLATMKPGAMLINTGRGALVNAAALIEALKSGQLGYLGLDVYEEEADIFFEDRSDQPLQDDVLARLLSFPNVVVTAHQAFLTREALAAIADTTLDNIAAWQDGTPRNRVRA
ncbi:TPA: NAD(P)-dependent oxidoreductase [Pseudomonas aeruginosa]